MIWFVLLLGFRRVFTIAMPNTGHGALARKFIVYKVLTEDWWCETTVDKSSSRFSLQAIYFKDLVRGARWVICSLRRIVFPNFIEVDAISLFQYLKRSSTAVIVPHVHGVNVLVDCTMFILNARLDRRGAVIIGCRVPTIGGVRSPSRPRTSTSITKWLLDKFDTRMYMEYGIYGIHGVQRFLVALFQLNFFSLNRGCPVTKPPSHLSISIYGGII